MADFDQLKSWLQAWHERRDRAAMGEFVRHYLQAAVARLGRRMRLSHDEVDELTQRVCERFLRRPELAERAEGVAYWNSAVYSRAIDFLRERKRLRPRSEPLPEAAAEGDAVDSEERLVEALAARGRDPRWLERQLALMPPQRRLFLLVHGHAVLLPWMTASDFAALEARCGLDEARVRAFLAAVQGQDPNALLPLLFSPAETATEVGRIRCLDTFRKGRKRALESLEAALKEAL